MEKSRREVDDRRRGRGGDCVFVEDLIGWYVFLLLIVDCRGECVRYLLLLII